MKSFNLHHLHTFCSVATTGGIRLSAEALSRAPSAVARAMSALEAHLDVPLFERRARGMLLTAAGDTVLVRALRIKTELEAVCADAARLRGWRRVRNGAVDALFQETRLRCASLLAQVHHMPTVAREIGLSQPAVSGAIRKLEDALGQPLFSRTARGMVPTETFVGWVARFDRALAELGHIASDVSDLKGMLEGTVTIGVRPLARTLIVPLAIVSLLKRHPRLRVHSLENTYVELCSGLLTGKVDFVLGAPRLEVDRELQSELLIDEPFSLLCRAGHPLLDVAAVGFDDVLAYPWALSPAGTPMRDSLDRFFREHGRPAPQPVVETGDQTLLRGLLLNSDMLTALSAHQLRYEIQAGSLKTLPFEMKGLRFRIGITTRAGAHLSPGAAALLDEVRQVSRTLVGSP